VYADPFNDVDVDVIFTLGEHEWRVPTFWRGGLRWTVRFTPPVQGTFDYRLESTNPADPDLSGPRGRVRIEPYDGETMLLRRGPLRVSPDGRHFEHADGTPFFWLADTWWPGLSTRLSWRGFRTLAADRRAKGFTVIQLVAGLKDPDEPSPTAPGFVNEGGPVWEPDFARINPRYFDAADRRIRHLVNSNLLPAIVGAWADSVTTLGVERLIKHWRYVIARYSAFPVAWILGGEVFDPTEQLAAELRRPDDRPFAFPLGDWTRVGRAVREIDPMHHPLTVHEVWPNDPPLQDDTLLDFRLFQPAHFSWPSIAVEVGQIGLHYARTDLTRPLIVGEIGYEHLAGEHLQDFQRAAFWLGMLNGAAGHSYGADGVWESATTDKPFPTMKFASGITWQEGMHLPGSSQVGIGATLLRRYPWWEMAPHPEWVAPRGTTLLEPRAGTPTSFHTALLGEWPTVVQDVFSGAPDRSVSEWRDRQGTFRLPYAAGVPGRFRIVYVPRVAVEDIFIATQRPTVLGLEVGVRYRACFWDPILGITFDLGIVERPVPGELLWEGGLRLATKGDGPTTLVPGVSASDVVVSTEGPGTRDLDVVLRYRGPEDHLTARYSAQDRTVTITEARGGQVRTSPWITTVGDLGPAIRLHAEARGQAMAASVTDGTRTYTTPIVNVGPAEPGRVGTRAVRQGRAARARVEVRACPDLTVEDRRERVLHDAWGGYRGELDGNGWEDYGSERTILLDAYRPLRFPNPQDWILVLDATGKGAAGEASTSGST
jgi:hypothetical protein